MYYWELILQILREMRAHKIRSILALLGIVWGTVAVVLLLALGEGFYRAGQKSMQSIANGAIRAWPGITSKAFQGQAPGQPIHMRISDLIAMTKALPDIKYFSPTLSIGNHVNLQWRAQQTTARIIGVAPDRALLTQLKLSTHSRFINAMDLANQKNVIVLGSKLKQQIFGNSNAIGQTILVYGIPFLVIGAQADEKTQDNFDWDQENAFIPYTTAQAIGGDQDIDGFILLTKNPNQSEKFVKTMSKFLGWRLHFDPTDHNAIYIFDTAQVTRFFTWFFRAIELFLGFCGLLTLGVGGIGVANIMFLIISERTQEFGLRMAVGAKPAHVLLQVLLETGVIILLGGLIGFIIAGTSIGLLQIISLPDWLGKPTLSPLIILATFLILALVGLIAGYFPARRAANMQPVEALSFG